MLGVVYFYWKSGKSSSIKENVVTEKIVFEAVPTNYSECMRTENKYNFPCRCKKGYGHWEACASGNNLVRFFDFWLNKNGIKQKFNFSEAKDIFNAASKKNQTALKFLDEVGTPTAVSGEGPLIKDSQVPNQMWKIITHEKAYSV